MENTDNSNLINNNPTPTTEPTITNQETLSPNQNIIEPEVIKDDSLISQNNQTLQENTTPNNNSKNNIYKILFYILLLIIIISISALAYYLVNIQKSVQTKITQSSIKKETINDSLLVPTPTTTPKEEVKEDVTKDWNIYADNTINLSFKYPKEIILMDMEALLKKNELTYPFINIQVDKISELDGLLSFDTNTALSNRELLEAGQTFKTKNIDPKAVQLNNRIYGQLSTVLSTPDVCDIQLKRSIVFYSGEYQIIINYAYRLGSSLIPDQYITRDKAKCGDNIIWKNENIFYKTAQNNQLENKTLQTWFNNFDEIIKTIKVIN